jgi:hypothetical protein
MKMQLCLRTFMRRLKLSRRAASLFAACEQGDLLAIRTALAANPSDAQLRDRSRRYCTLHHAAIRGGQLEALKLLGLTMKDVEKRNADGDILVHVLARHPSASILFFVASRVEALEQGGSRVSTAPKSGGGGSQKARPPLPPPAHSIRQSIAAMGGILKTVIIIYIALFSLCDKINRILTFSPSQIGMVKQAKGWQELAATLVRSHSRQADLL